MPLTRSRKSGATSIINNSAGRNSFADCLVIDLAGGRKRRGVRPSNPPAPHRQVGPS